jgi:hypothetical protein
VNEFVARRPGNDPRVRLLASGDDFCPCRPHSLRIDRAGDPVKPLLSDHAGLCGLSVADALALMVLYTTLSGNSGAMHTGQMQLGVLYLGLFGAANLLLYLHRRPPFPENPGRVRLSIQQRG